VADLAPPVNPARPAQLMHRHRVDDSINKAIAKLIRVDLVVIDDVGLLPISTDAAEALFRRSEPPSHLRSCPEPQKTPIHPQMARSPIILKKPVASDAGSGLGSALGSEASNPSQGPNCADNFA
jgi:hypothetical protein